MAGFDDVPAGQRAALARAQRSGFGIVPILPDIPLWIPDEAKRAINELVLDTIRLALHLTSDAISDEAQQFADSGALAQSWGNDPATAAGGVELIGVDIQTGIEGRVFSSLPYAIVMERGRYPGSPISRDGIDAIGLWAQRKLGLSADEANTAKWAIANTIIARGIEGKGYVEAGFNRASPKIEQLFKVLNEAILKALTTTGTD